MEREIGNMYVVGAMIYILYEVPEATFTQTVCRSEDILDITGEVEKSFMNTEACLEEVTIRYPSVNLGGKYYGLLHWYAENA